MNFVVRQIKPELCSQWFLYKHYAKRKPNVSYAFGLYDEESILIGVCSYAKPMSQTLVAGAFGGEYQKEFLELNRLVVNDGLPRNTLSFFVSRTLKLLPSPCAVVSYADTSQNHHGYIYQATNWVYTGLSKKFVDYAVKGLEHLHHSSIEDSVGRHDKTPSINKKKLLMEKYGDALYKVERPRKHRYFYFIGNRTEKKDMRKKLCYKKHPYPKGDNVRYDSSFLPQIQLELV
jgi:hypothetical protein|tara:strand:- start:46 stop:741 length:696 start_codon:yes stop_codon:yes gene_type:complete